MYTLFVDDREKYSLDSISEKANVKKQRLYSGDFAVVRDSPVPYVCMIFERKTWADLEASRKDGRLSNVENLLNVRAKVGAAHCLIFYIIEGKYSVNMRIRKKYISKNALQAHLDHLIMKHNIHIIYTKNTEDTLERILELINNHQSLEGSDRPPDPQHSFEEMSSGLGDVLEYRPPKEVPLILLWRQIPKLTFNLIEQLVDNYSIGNFLYSCIHAPEFLQTLANLEYSSKSIVGADRARQIIDNIKINTSEILIKIISEIRGISAITAKKCINEYGYFWNSEKTLDINWENNKKKIILLEINKH